VAVGEFQLWLEPFFTFFEPRKLVSDATEGDAGDAELFGFISHHYRDPRLVDAVTGLRIGVDENGRYDRNLGHRLHKQR
jgi:hypothetical protein|tara:strand:+ start:117 stop:353 length:237 start_codon:yes stop_codon:yes gene_type:complete